MPDEAPPRLETRGLRRELRSGERTLVVVDDVDLQVAAGECVSIRGPSGAGKSTLLALLAGLDRPTAGSVLIDGQPIEWLGEDELALLRREKIGFVFQAFQLLPNLTARENVQFPLDLLGRRHSGRPGGGTARRSPAWRNAPTTIRRSSRAASSSASPWPGRSRPSRRSSSATSRPATWTP